MRSKVEAVSYRRVESTRRSLEPSPNRVWAALFAIWGLFLSGILGNWVGSPGVLQAVRLQSLLESKQEQLRTLTAETERLERESQRLEGSRTAQEREIRKVLGYARQDEVIFDFGSSDYFGLVSHSR